MPFALGGTLQDAGGDNGLWYIGTTRGPASNFNCNGLIDEVAIYPRALTEGEISEHIRLASVPEPASWLLLGLGAVFLASRTTGLRARRFQADR